MSVRQKKMITAVVLAVLGVIFLYAFLSQPEGAAAPSHKDEKKDNRSATQEVQGTANQTETDDSGSTDEDNTPLTAADKKTSKKVAIDFAKAYYTYDSKHPSAYIKQSKNYMTDRLYDFESHHIRRQTLDRQKTTYKDNAVYPVDDPDAAPGEITWNVVVMGEAISRDGKTHKEEMWYFITLERDNGTWKVKGVSVQ